MPRPHDLTQEVRQTDLGASVGDAHSASMACRMRASAAFSLNPFWAYARAACLATSTTTRPHAAGSFHKGFMVSCCPLLGDAHTRSTSTALGSEPATGGSVRALECRRLPNIAIPQDPNLFHRCVMTANLAGEKPPVVGVLSDCESWLYQEAARSDFWHRPAALVRLLPPIGAHVDLTEWRF